MAKIDRAESTRLHATEAKAAQLPLPSGFCWAAGGDRIGSPRAAPTCERHALPSLYRRGHARAGALTGEAHFLYWCSATGPPLSCTSAAAAMKS
jgi:hypothetical protein